MTRTSKGVEYAEHRATIPAEVGFECTFYEGIFYRTAPLRKSLYVAVVVPDGEFRPGFTEHFPKAELVSYMVRNGLAAYGQGEAFDVVFRCYSPAGSGSAKEGVLIIGDALETLRDRLALSEGARSKAAMRDGLRGIREHILGGLNHPYRPPPDALGERTRVPAPRRRGGSFGEVIRQQFRDELEQWGVLEDYDRMNAERAKRQKLRAKAEVLARDSPYARGAAVVERWRAFDEQVKAMNERYGRMGGGW